MPIYDRRCLSCEWTRDDCYEPREYVQPCPSCGGATERLYTGRVNVIPDTFAIPLVDDNIAKTTQVFYSRSERKAAMKRLGMREAVRHVEFNHSDKSPHTIKWR